VPLDPLDPLDPLEPLDPLDPLDPLEPLDPLDPLEPLEPPGLAQVKSERSPLHSLRDELQSGLLSFGSIGQSVSALHGIVQ